ncbi:hypothetical protein PR048_020070 [Dryococelus australis]|uniref:Uncharacterized protein n=1 Tax=Dryococelus australis TaxID=614101 RepID=A0ABQ9H5E1_9NEOP|nr:hypothetical protein PR048_020070 [Dryococelus australis]
MAILVKLIKPKAEMEDVRTLNNDVLTQLHDVVCKRFSDLHENNLIRFEIKILLDKMWPTDEKNIHELTLDNGFQKLQTAFSKFGARLLRSETLSCLKCTSREINFSIMKRVKTDYQNRLKTTILDNLMRIFIEGPE